MHYPRKGKNLAKRELERVVPREKEGGRGAVANKQRTVRSKGMNIVEPNPQILFYSKAFWVQLKDWKSDQPSPLALVRQLLLVLHCC